MLSSISHTLCNFYDTLQTAWSRPTSERRIGLVLLWIYLLILAAVELRRLGYYPNWLPELPASHFYSIQVAFTLILALEVISLIFIIPASISRSIGKQLEILTLILLRNAFKELSILPEPVSVNMNDFSHVLNIAISSLGALGVFLCLGLYRRIMSARPLLTNDSDKERYILSKKILALCLLVVFIAIGIYDIYLYKEGIRSEFFETVYTSLIFADIALVLISQRYMPCYFAVFRNSGLVIGTLMMRLSLSAPPWLSAAIAVFAALYVVGLTWGTNYFAPETSE